MPNAFSLTCLLVGYLLGFSFVHPHLTIKTLLALTLPYTSSLPEVIVLQDDTVKHFVSEALTFTIVYWVSERLQQF